MLEKLPKSRGLRFLLAIGLLCFLLAVDAAYAGLRFRASFKGAACDLKRATDRISELDVDRGLEKLEAARSGLATSGRYLEHPAFLIGGLLPRLDRDISALRDLQEVAEHAVRAGLEGAAAAEAMGLTESGSLSALYDDGRISFDALDEGSAAIEDALERLQQAREILDGSPRPNIASVRSVAAGASRIVNQAISQLRSASSIAAAIPDVLGRGETRRYLLTFQTPSEARGGGGLVGVYGVLRADAGRITLEKIAPIRELVPLLKRPVDGPEWYRDLYASLDALGGWREANLSPDFPTSSEVLLDMYESAVGDELDGVIAMDPFVVEDLTRGTGPIRAEGLDVDVGPGNAADVLLKDIYVEFERQEEEQNRYLRDLVDELWSRLSEGDVDGSKLAKGLAHAIRTQHLKMYSTDPAEQGALAEAGLSGDPQHFGPHVQMVFHNNFSASKVDYFLQRSQDMSVVIDDSGDARIVTTVELHNDAPRGELDVLKETDLNDLPAGLNRMGLFFMLSEGARIDTYFTGSVENTYFDGSESGRYPIAWKALDIQVQETVENSVAYTVPDLVEFQAGKGVLELTLLPQTLVRPDDLSVRIVPPEGYRIGRNQPGARFRTGAITIEGSLASPKTLRYTLVGPDAKLPQSTSLDSACG